VLLVSLSAAELKEELVLFDDVELLGEAAVSDKTRLVLKALVVNVVPRRSTDVTLETSSELNEMIGLYPMPRASHALAELAYQNS
jgi:hypothetical protein